jgi:hypothetical protein
MYPRANTLGIILKKNYILLEEQKGNHSKGNGLFYRPKRLPSTRLIEEATCNTTP